MEKGGSICKQVGICSGTVGRLSIHHSGIDVNVIDSGRTLDTLLYTSQVVQDF